MLRLNASKGPRCPTPSHRVKTEPVRRTEDIRAQRHEERLQRRAERLKHLDDQSKEQFLQALETKECMLEIQSDLLSKLAAEHNALEGFSGPRRGDVSSFNDHLKEVEQALTVIQY